jgi:hypothetical protein
MTPRQIFILILRVFGVWQLADTIEHVFSSICMAAGYYKLPFTTVGSSLLMALAHFILAIWLLGFAPPTASIFYRDEPKRTSDDQ